METLFAVAREIAGSIRTAQRFRFDKQVLKNYACSLLVRPWCENVNYTYIFSLMFVPCTVWLGITDQHYALRYITPLFDTQAPTCFSIHVPSSGSFSCPRELLESRNICHILWVLVACVHWLLWFRVLCCPAGRICSPYELLHCFTQSSVLQNCALHIKSCCINIL
jgi:hypothetical protein